MTEHLRDATSIAETVRSGAVRAVDVLAEHRARIENGGDAWNAIVATDFATAEADAAAIDRLIAAGEPVGSLAGVPMSVKDSFAVAGMRTTHGRLSDAQEGAPDAPAVAKLRAAGALLYGKSNVPVLLADYQTRNADFGATLNPWDAAVSPGGSSGGSAVAVATGLSAAELGSDLAGSIRIPAAWNGVFGHRPTNGVISKRGHLPWRLDSRIDPPNSVSGPLARSARDLELLFGVLAGAAGAEAAGWQLRTSDTALTAIADLRVGLWVDSAVAPTSREMRTAIRALADALADAGATVRAVRTVPGADAEGLALFDRLAQAEIAHSVDEGTYRSLVGEPGTVGQSMHDAWRDLEAQRRVREAWTREVFTEVDVVLAPAVFGAAPALDLRPDAERRLVIAGVGYDAPAAVSAWSCIPNLAMLPCTVVPLGLGADSGLPLGGQLIGRPFDDAVTLRLAALMEDAGMVRHLGCSYA
jgi:amidase